MARHKTQKEKLLYLGLEKATKTIRERFNNMPFLRTHKLSLEQWLIIEIVANTPNINQKKIIEKLGKEPASISRLVSKLEQKNLLVKKIHPEDKKQTQLSLTPESTELFSSNRKQIDKEFREIFNSLYEREFYLMLDLLTRFTK